MANKEQREQFKRYKEDVEKRGKQFFPHAMFHDTVMSLVVVSVIVALACDLVLHGRARRPGTPACSGRATRSEADPGTTSFVPRPDWYFFFLFYLLRIFKWPESVILGTVGIPTILIILLLALPFLDRRRERRLARRPVAVVAALLVVASMGILTYKGATAEEPSATSGDGFARWKANGDRAGRRGRVAGADLVAEVGCLNCHTYARRGRRRARGRTSAEVGDSGRGEEYWVDWVREPAVDQAGLADAGLPEPDRRAAAATSPPSSRRRRAGGGE